MPMFDIVIANLDCWPENSDPGRSGVGLGTSGTISEMPFQKVVTADIPSVTGSKNATNWEILVTSTTSTRSTTFRET